MLEWKLWISQRPALQEPLQKQCSCNPAADKDLAL
uniref:Peptidyl-prolyl cis-trans isomerase n=1 Tax=Rhizophora mucronata TaxID=61149 RepID=A0A2P2J3A4_RHIMU